MNEEFGPAPWGTFAPRGMGRIVLILCRLLPAGVPALYRVTKLLRAVMKRRRLQFYDVECRGLRLRLQNRGNYTDTRLLFSPQFYDREELDWLCAELESGGTFLDIGGNIGAYSLLVGARLGPKVSVHTVEPAPGLCKRIEINRAFNKVQLELHQIALSDYDGDGHIVLSAPQQGENRLCAGGAAPDDSVRVPVTTLHGLCESSGIREIRALKIDIEGHEYRVLSRFFEVAPVSLRPGAIVIERTEDRHGLIELLESRYGYSTVAITKRNALLRRG